MIRTIWLAFCFSSVACLSLAGCQKKSDFEYDAHDLVPPPEELTEFPLGHYRIPIPIAEERGQHLAYRHRLQLDFELHALVSPSEQSQLASAWSRHEGKIRDQVIRICRTATIDELQEPDFATLKARLLHALASQIGEKDMRQLLITKVMSQNI